MHGKRQFFSLSFFFFFLPHPPTSPLNLFNCELSSVCKTTHRNHTFKQQQQTNKQNKKTTTNHTIKVNLRAGETKVAKPIND